MAHQPSSTLMPGSPKRACGRGAHSGAGKVQVMTQPCGLAAVARSSSRHRMPNCSGHKKGDKQRRKTDGIQREEMEDTARTFSTKKLRWDLTRVSGDHTWPHPILQVTEIPQHTGPCFWVLTSSPPDLDQHICFPASPLNPPHPSW